MSQLLSVLKSRHITQDLWRIQCTVAQGTESLKGSPKIKAQNILHDLGKSTSLFLWLGLSYKLNRVRGCSRALEFNPL